MFSKIFGLFQEKEVKHQNSHLSDEQKQLIVACETGDIGATLDLSDIDVNYFDDTGWAPIHYAAQIGNMPIIRILCNSNANPNLITKDGYTPAHLLISYFNRIMNAMKSGSLPQEQGIGLIQQCMNCFNSLISAGADLTIKSPQGIIPQDFLQKIGAIHHI